MSVRVLAAACVLLGTASASAQTAASAPAERRGERYTQLVLDGSFAHAITSGTAGGAGGALRVGHAIPVPWLVLVPEVGFDSFYLSGPRETVTYGGFAGGRLRLAGMVEPGIFTHVGACGLKRDDQRSTRACIDVGLTVDVTFYERLLTGLQAQYKTALASSSDDRFAWFTIGASIGVKL